MAATLKASTQGLDIVERARRVKGWTKTSQEWADLATTSKATLRRFWAGIPIQSATFKEICYAIGINEWENVADFSQLATRPKAQSPATVSRRLAFAIAGSIEEIDKRKLDAIVALLNQLGGDMSIEILDVEEGSIKLILGGSPSALARIEALFKSGHLKEVSSVPVRYVAFEENKKDPSNYFDRTPNRFLPEPSLESSTYSTLKSRRSRSIHSDSPRSRNTRGGPNMRLSPTFISSVIALVILVFFVLIYFTTN